MSTDNFEYVGFWPRVGASVIDIIIQLIVTAPLTYAVYGRYTSPDSFYFMGKADALINLVLPAVVIIALWVRFGATPGKMAMSARIVDADTGEPLTIGASALRYLGYIISIIPCGLGFLWVAFDRRKQGWHDKMANSVVIRPAGVEAVHFRGKQDWRDGSGGPTDPKF